MSNVRNIFCCLQEPYTCCSFYHKKVITIAVFGLDGAGKTVTVQAVKGRFEPVVPTVGFNNEDVKIFGCQLKFYDLGGSSTFRGVWKSYVHQVHGMIYVIDSVNQSSLDESRKAFTDIITHDRFVGKPVLILANKQDLAGAIEIEEIDKRLHLKNLCYKNGSQCYIKSCSALIGSGRKMDKRLKQGLHWLCEEIINNWHDINGRLENDITEVNAIRDQELAERKAKVQAIRDQREKDQGHDAIEEDTDLVISTKDKRNPFKPLNMDLVKDIEAQEKRRLEISSSKEQMLYNNNNNNEQSSSPVIIVHRNRDSEIYDSDHSDNGDVVTYFSTSSRLPSLSNKKESSNEHKKWIKSQDQSHNPGYDNLKNGFVSSTNSSQSHPMNGVYLKHSELTSIESLCRPQLSPISRVITQSEDGDVSDNALDDSHGVTKETDFRQRFKNDLDSYNQQHVARKRGRKKKLRMRNSKLHPLDPANHPFSQDALSRPLPPLLQKQDNKAFISREETDSGIESIHHNWALVEDVEDESTLRSRSCNSQPNYDGSDEIIT